ncbi:hypothetical protein BGX31_001865, partial [Mortierella sp. GBA43]
MKRAQIEIETPVPVSSSPIQLPDTLSIASTSSSTPSPTSSPSPSPSPERQLEIERSEELLEQNRQRQEELIRDYKTPTPSLLSWRAQKNLQKKKRKELEAAAQLQSRKHARVTEGDHPEPSSKRNKGNDISM